MKMTCVCGFEGKVEDFTEVYFRKGARELKEYRFAEKMAVRVEVYACPECRTLRLESDY